MKRSIPWRAVVGLLPWLLVGCGQIGPLYLPDQPPPAAPSGTAP